MNRTKIKLHMIVYLFIFCLNGYWLFNRDMLSGNMQFSICVLSVGLVVLTAFMQWLFTSGSENKRSIVKWTVWILFLYYLYILLEVLFLGGLFGLSRESGGGGRMNLIPFRTIRAYATVYARYPAASITNIFGNLIVFMPMGIFLPVLFRAMKRWYFYFPFMGILLVSVEVMQNITDRGRADIDDVILNFAGAAAIYIVWSIITWIAKIFKR